MYNAVLNCTGCASIADFAFETAASVIYNLVRVQRERQKRLQAFGLGCMDLGRRYSSTSKYTMPVQITLVL